MRNNRTVTKLAVALTTIAGLIILPSEQAKAIDYDKLKTLVIDVAAKVLMAEGRLSLAEDLEGSVATLTIAPGTIDASLKKAQQTCRYFHAEGISYSHEEFSNSMRYQFRNQINALSPDARANRNLVQVVALTIATDSLGVVAVCPDRIHS
jgi:hypothetical protein